MIAAAVSAAAFGSGCASSAPEPPRAAISVPTTTRVVRIDREPIDARVFLDAARFRLAWSSSPATSDTPDGRVVAGVVNHHVLASDLLADFFRRLKTAHPDARRIIILSPDHFSAGRASVSTHRRPYATPDGPLFVDATATAALLANGIVSEEDGGMFEKEHGVGALVPFLRHEFPDVSIVPFAVRGTMPREEARAFGRALSGIVDNRTVVVISADMSHYLPETEALANDEETLRRLRSADMGWLGRVGDGFVDNGASFVVLGAVFGEKGMTPTFTPFGHSISTRYGGPRDNTTSYLTGVWSE
jgi:AmmeMemoRadiSam system protein B